jgi:hypothetical protein
MSDERGRRGAIVQLVACLANWCSWGSGHIWRCPTGTAQDRNHQFGPNSPVPLSLHQSVRLAGGGGGKHVRRRESERYKIREASKSITED